MKLFGTDGIRGEANRFPMNPETCLLVGKAVAGSIMGTHNKSIIIGKDTRISGDMIVSALCAGICSMGAIARPVGTITTPGVAFLVRKLGADLGIVVSASHNPYMDNGIKLFDSEGYKVTESFESIVEGHVETFCNRLKPADPAGIGIIHEEKDAGKDYIFFLKNSISVHDLRGMRIVIDCANGAAGTIAPVVFEELGADLTVLSNNPDGRNINVECGSQDIRRLRTEVDKKGADIGFAFDGDADRVIVIDETGKKLTGDQILVACAEYMKNKGTLAGNILVSTVMSNIGLRIACRRMGIEHIVTDVGDRNVLETMRKNKAVIGGEDSGHIIFLDGHTSGDGIFTALRLIEIMKKEGKKASELGSLMEKYPQVLLNLPVKEKIPLERLEGVMDTIESIQERLGENARILVRYSGTRPLCRIMVEGMEQEKIEAAAEEIKEIIKKALEKM